MFLSWKLHGIISYHQILTRKHFPIVWNLLLEKIWRKTWILPWSLHFMQNLFFGLWSKFKSWLRLLCVNIDYTLWIQLDTQIFNAKINDFKCLKYNWGYVLWGGKLLRWSRALWSQWSSSYTAAMLPCLNIFLTAVQVGSWLLPRGVREHWWGVQSSSCQ